MTQDELDALPEINLGGFRSQLRIIDGQEVIVSIAEPMVVLFNKEHDPLDILDRHGIRYIVGWHNGVRYKSKRIHQFHNTGYEENSEWSSYERGFKDAQDRAARLCEEAKMFNHSVWDQACDTLAEKIRKLGTT